jgi:hypothetical protein
MTKIETLEARIAALEQQMDDFTTRVAARLEAMQIRRAQPRDTGDLPPASNLPQMIAGRWYKRDGNVYGRYTYEGTMAAPKNKLLDRIDRQLRRSPPATE